MADRIGAELVLGKQDDDRFALYGLDSFRIRFERDASRSVSARVGVYGNGNEEPSPRSGG